MAQQTKERVTRDRLDHRLPESYLEGFLDDGATQLAVYDRQRKRWFDAIPRQIAAERGYYDYSMGSTPDQTADDAFQALEERFPNVRRALVAANFEGWEAERDFLLTYAQMLRTRTELFREQVLAGARTQVMLRVAEVIPDPENDTTTIRYEEPTETPEEREVLYRNQTITVMRSEIAQGIGRFRDLHWSVRLAPDPADPVITSDYPVIAEGNTPTEELILEDPSTSSSSRSADKHA